MAIWKLPLCAWRLISPSPISLGWYSPRGRPACAAIAAACSAPAAVGMACIVAPPVSLHIRLSCIRPQPVIRRWPIPRRPLHSPCCSGISSAVRACWWRTSCACSRRPMSLGSVVSSPVACSIWRIALRTPVAVPRAWAAACSCFLESWVLAWTVLECSSTVLVASCNPSENLSSSSLARRSWPGVPLDHASPAALIPGTTSRSDSWLSPATPCRVRRRACSGPTPPLIRVSGEVCPSHASPAGVSCVGAAPSMVATVFCDCARTGASSRSVDCWVVKNLLMAVSVSSAAASKPSPLGSARSMAFRRLVILFPSATRASSALENGLPCLRGMSRSLAMSIAWPIRSCASFPIDSSY